MNIIMGIYCYKIVMEILSSKFLEHTTCTATSLDLVFLSTAVRDLHTHMMWSPSKADTIGINKNCPL